MFEVISAATSSASASMSICRLMRHFLTPTITPPRPSFRSFLYSSPQPGGMISKFDTDGFNQVSQPRMTSGLHSSRAFQNNSFFESMLEKFNIRIRRTSFGHDVGACLIGEDVADGFAFGPGVSPNERFWRSSPDVDILESSWNDSNRLEEKCGTPHEQQCHEASGWATAL